MRGRKRQQNVGISLYTNAYKDENKKERKQQKDIIVNEYI